MVKFFPGIAWEIATGWLSETQRIRLLLIKQCMRLVNKSVNVKKTILTMKWIIVQIF